MQDSLLLRSPTQTKTPNTPRQQTNQGHQSKKNVESKRGIRRHGSLCDWECSKTLQMFFCTRDIFGDVCMFVNGGSVWIGRPRSACPKKRKKIMLVEKPSSWICRGSVRPYFFLAASTVRWKSPSPPDDMKCRWLKDRTHERERNWKEKKREKKRVNHWAASQTALRALNAGRPFRQLKLNSLYVFHFINCQDHTLQIWFNCTQHTPQN